MKMGNVGEKFFMHGVKAILAITLTAMALCPSTVHAEENKNSRTVTLQNCNNDYHFYGRHVVDISEAFGSVNLPDRYVICMD